MSASTQGQTVLLTVPLVVVLSSVQLCHPTDYSPPDPSVHGVSQARILEWVVISFSRGSSRPKDQTHVSCIGRRILYHWATREAFTVPFGLTQTGAGGLAMTKLSPHYCQNRALTCLWYFDWQRILPTYLHLTCLLGHQGLLHLYARGSLVARSYYFNQGFTTDSVLRARVLPLPSGSLFLIIFNPSMIPLRCTTGVDRSQIIRLAGSCVISGLQLFVFSASNLGGTKTKQNQTTKCLWGPLPLPPHCLCWTLKDLSTKKYKKKHSFLLSVSETLTFHSTFLSPEVQAPLS